MWWLSEGRGKDRVQGLLQEETPMQWRWIEGGTVRPVRDLGTWPVTVEIEEEGGRWMEEG